VLDPLTKGRLRLDRRWSHAARDGPRRGPSWRSRATVPAVGRIVGRRAV